jgi:hypothetical protein
MSEKTTAENWQPIDFVFDGPPGPEGPRFVEVEQGGKAIKLGLWMQRADGYWVLRLDERVLP